MAQIFTRGRSVFFFAENFLHANPVLQSKANLYFQEQGTVTLVPVASLPKERRCQSRPGRACVLDGWPLRCNELESTISSFFGSSSPWSFSTMMWKKPRTWHRSSPASSGLRSEAQQRLVISKRNPQHRQQCGDLVHVLKTSSAKRLSVLGEVDRYCHWHRHRRETAD